MNAETRRFLLQAGLWAATGRIFPLLPEGAGAPATVGAALFSLAGQEKMLPMLAAYARNQGLDLGDDLQALCEVSRLASGALYRHLSPVLADCETRGVRTVLLKGGDLNLSVYPENLPRFMLDLDLMVPTTDLATTEEIFRDAGFRPGQIDKQSLTITPLSAEERAAEEEGHYELVPFRKLIPLPELIPYRDAIARHVTVDNLIVAGEDIFFVLEYDIHFNISHGFDLADVWTGLRRTTLPDGREVLAQSFSDLIWFLTARMYHELMMFDSPVLRLFVDVVVLVHNRGSEVDWERVRDMGQKYNLQPCLFYTLWHVNELLGPQVPEKILAALDPRTLTVRSHDWGDFAPRLTGGLATSPLIAF